VINRTASEHRTWLAPDIYDYLRKNTVIHQTTTHQWVHYAGSVPDDARVQDTGFTSRFIAQHGASDWQERAIAAYRDVQRQRMAELCARLISEVGRLTEQSIATESIVVDRDAGFAQVVLDGIRFQMSGEALVLLRACVRCGDSEFRSTPLTTVSDLGYALVGWHPQCDRCISNSIWSKIPLT
jgi:hypothetical protein